MLNIENTKYEDFSRELEEIIKDPDKYSYHKLRNIVKDIYSCKELTNDEVELLEEDIRKIERLFSYKKVEPYLAFITMLCTVALMGDFDVTSKFIALFLSLIAILAIHFKL